MIFHVSQFQRGCKRLPCHDTLRHFAKQFLQVRFWRSGYHAIKIGKHDFGPVTTGDDRDGIVSAAGREEVRAFVRTTLPDLDPDPVGEVTCLYTSTATEDFILDRRGPFVVCSACSGHGAKFAPLTGEIAADLACGGPPADPRFTLPAHGG